MSMKRAPAVARRANRHRIGRWIAPAMRIGMAAIETPSHSASRSTAATWLRPASASESDAPDAWSNGVATSSPMIGTPLR